MNDPLASNSDRPYGGQAKVVVVEGEYEHPAVNSAKLCFLILLTYGLIVAVWFISLAIEQMHEHSVPLSYQDGGGLLFGLFCFYVLCFGLAWYWGSGKREEMRRAVVEQQIARQKAMEAMMQME